MESAHKRFGLSGCIRPGLFREFLLTEPLEERLELGVEFSLQLPLLARLVCIAPGAGDAPPFAVDRKWVQQQPLSAVRTRHLSPDSELRRFAPSPAQRTADSKLRRAVFPPPSPMSLVAPRGDDRRTDFDSFHH